jgi:hypothetical protein
VRERSIICTAGRDIFMVGGEAREEVRRATRESNEPQQQMTVRQNAQGPPQLPPFARLRVPRFPGGASVAGDASCACAAALRFEPATIVGVEPALGVGGGFGFGVFASFGVLFALVVAAAAGDGCDGGAGCGVAAALVGGGGGGAGGGKPPAPPGIVMDCGVDGNEESPAACGAPSWWSPPCPAGSPGWCRMEMPCGNCGNISCAYELSEAVVGYQLRARARSNLSAPRGPRPRIRE